MCRWLIGAAMAQQTGSEFLNCLEIGGVQRFASGFLLEYKSGRNERMKMMRKRRRRHLQIRSKLPEVHARSACPHQTPEQTEADRVSQSRQRMRHPIKVRIIHSVRLNRFYRIFNPLVFSGEQVAPRQVLLLDLISL
jgi:hypothetical protein